MVVISVLIINRNTPLAIEPTIPKSIETRSRLILDSLYLAESLGAMNDGIEIGMEPNDIAPVKRFRSPRSNNGNLRVTAILKTKLAASVSNVLNIRIVRTLNELNSAYFITSFATDLSIPA